MLVEINTLLIVFDVDILFCKSFWLFECFVNTKSARQPNKNAESWVRRVKDGILQFYYNNTWVGTTGFPEKAINSTTNQISLAIRGGYVPNTIKNREYQNLYFRLKLG